MEKKRKWGDFIFLGSKITADGDCSHKIKRHLLLGRKAMTNLDSSGKQRHHFANKGPYSQSCGFSGSHVWMWESHTKKAEHWRIDTFELWCWKTLLKVPWTARKSNQSTTKEFIPEYLLEGLILKLKLQYFGHMMWRADSLEKTLMLWRIEGRRRGGQDEMLGWHHRPDGHEFELAPAVGAGQGSLACCSRGVTKS